MSGPPPNDWRDEAHCATPADPTPVPPPDFYANSAVEQRRAARLCTDCPVRRTCLQAALDHEDGWGVWGGTVPRVRRRALLVNDDAARTRCPYCSRVAVTYENLRRVRVRATCAACGLTWMQRRRTKKERAEPE